MRLAADSVRRVAGIVGRAVDTALPMEATTRRVADIALPVEPIVLRVAATAAAETLVEDSTAVAMAEDVPVAVAGTPVAGTAAVGATKRQEARNVMSNLRVIAWLAWLTASAWLTRYNEPSRERAR